MKATLPQTVKQGRFAFYIFWLYLFKSQFYQRTGASCKCAGAKVAVIFRKQNCAQLYKAQSTELCKNCTMFALCHMPLWSLQIYCYKSCHIMMVKLTPRLHFSNLFKFAAHHSKYKKIVLQHTNNKISPKWNRLLFCTIYFYKIVKHLKNSLPSCINKYFSWM